MATSLIHLALQTVAMMLTALLLPKLRITSILGAVGIVLALSIINTYYWDAALFFNLPTSATTQTGILILSNGFIFWALVKILPGIEIDGIFTALIAPIIFTVCNVIVSTYAPLIDWNKVIDDGKHFIEGMKEYVKK